MGNKYHVTLVNDDLNLLEILSLYLGEDFEVTTFNDPRNAMQFVDSHVVDVLVLDYHLTPANYMKLVKKFKSIDPHLPILILSDNEALELKIKALRASAFEFLRKPFNGQKLVDTLHKLIKYSFDKTSSLVRFKLSQLSAKELETLSLLVKKENFYVR